MLADEEVAQGEVFARGRVHDLPWDREGVIKLIILIILITNITSIIIVKLLGHTQPHLQTSIEFK